MFESELKILVGNCSLLVYRRSKELRVIDLAQFFVAKTLEYLLYQVIWHEGHLTVEPESFLNFVDGDASRVGGVNETERISDRFEVKVHRDVVHKPLERFHLELLRRPEAFHAVHDLLLDLDRRLKDLLLKPSVLEAVLSGNACLRIFIQHTGDETLRFIGHAHPDLVFKFDLLLQHVAEDLRAIVALERRVAAEEYVQDNAEAPHIAGLVVILLENLWCDVVRRANDRFEVDLFRQIAERAFKDSKPLRQPKINQFDFCVA